MLLSGETNISRIRPGIKTGDKTGDGSGFWPSNNVA